MFKRIIILISITGISFSVFGGPPFETDDPEPVEYRHWEFYIASADLKTHDYISGTLPHLETNYGIIPNVQIHILLPVNYSFATDQGMQYGYANTEIGVKYRFIKENDFTPQVGIFPIIEIPTIQNRIFGNNKTQIYFPIWIQKSWNKFTTYGGAGYWINPGRGNKNWLFSGWLLQYDFSRMITIGGELFYHSSISAEDNDFIGLNAGGFLNLSDNFHIIYSAGHNVYSKGNTFMFYIGMLWTI